MMNEVCRTLGDCTYDLGFVGSDVCIYPSTQDYSRIDKLLREASAVFHNSVSTSGRPEIRVVSIPPKIEDEKKIYTHEDKGLIVCRGKLDLQIGADLLMLINLINLKDRYIIIGDGLAGMKVDKALLDTLRLLEKANIVTVGHDIVYTVHVA